MKAVITSGVSCSGKSTYAANLVSLHGFIEVNRDNIRWHIMTERGKVPNWKNWNWKHEKRVTEIAEQEIAVLAQNGRDIVVSDTNLFPAKRDEMKAKLEALGYDVTVHFLEIDWEEAVRRDNERENGVGYSVLAGQFERWHREHTNQVTYSEELPDAVIIDVDGTVAKMQGRSPFAWDRVGEDAPDWVTIFAITGLIERGAVPIVVSGRDSVCRGLTEDWFERYAPQLYHSKNKKHNLFMRAEGDQRKDTIIKREIFDEHIRYNYNVVAVFDDRPSVCRMWRSLGLDVFQRGNPYIEF